MNTSGEVGLGEGLEMVFWEDLNFIYSIYIIYNINN